MTAIITFLISAACGFAMWFVLSSMKESYKQIYALYLMVITGAIMTFVMQFQSLFAIGIAMAAYVVFLSLTNAEPARVWVLPSLWLSGFGLWLIFKNHAKLEYTIAFIALSLLTCLYPFMGEIQRGKDAADIDYSDESEFDEFVIRKNKLFIYYGLVTGLTGCLAVVIIGMFQ